MSSSQYGCKLNPYRHLCRSLRVKGVQQSVVITNNLSMTYQNQHLLIWFPSLDSHDVISSQGPDASFIIMLNSTNANRTVVQNLSIMKKMVRISRNEVMFTDNSDVYWFYYDLWKTTHERDGSRYKGLTPLPTRPSQCCASGLVMPATLRHNTKRS